MEKSNPPKVLSFLYSFNKSLLADLRLAKHNLEVHHKILLETDLYKNKEYLDRLYPDGFQKLNDHLNDLISELSFSISITENQRELFQEGLELIEFLLQKEK